jgi:hypothetical protein
MSPVQPLRLPVFHNLPATEFSSVHVLHKHDHRFAVVAQCLLREPFRVANGFSPFRSRITAAVQRHAVNAKLPTT